MSLQLQFLEKRGFTSSQKKIYWPKFSGTIEYDNREKTSYRGPEGVLTNIVHVINLFL